MRAHISIPKLQEAHAGPGPGSLMQKLANNFTRNANCACIKICQDRCKRQRRPSTASLPAQQPQSARHVATHAAWTPNPTAEVVQLPSRANLYDGDGRLCVKSATLQELQQWFAAQGERPGRADQLWRWVYGNWRTAASQPGTASSSSSSSSSSSVATGHTPPHSYPYFGGGLRRLADAAQPAVDGFSSGFVERFGPRLSFEGGLELLEVTPASDGTRKLVFRVTGGEAAGGRIETVLIPWYRDYDPRVGRQEEPRYTLCVSSQVGCAMNCQFCYTGRMGLRGNLTTAQIIEQVLVAQQLVEAESTRGDRSWGQEHGPTAPSSPSPASTPNPASSLTSTPACPPPLPAAAAPPLRPGPITNIVFMGMGEPLHNSEAVFGAIDVMTHRRGLGLSASRITLSTVGLLPQLQTFLDRYAPPPPPSPPPSSTSPSTTSSTTSSASSPASPPITSSTAPRVSLAVSIHAGTDELRAALVPSNTRLTLSPSPSLNPRATTDASSPSAFSSSSPPSSSSPSSPSSSPLAQRDAADGGGGGNGGNGGNGSGNGGGGLLRGLSALSAVLSTHYPRTDRRPLRAGRYVLFEYTLLGGVNDRPADAAALLEATRDIECSFNLIMFNPFPGTLYQPSTPEQVEAFRRVLREAGRIVHVRHSKGDSGMAACGQLGDVGPTPTSAAVAGAGGSGRGRRAGGAKMLPEARALAAAAEAAAAAVDAA
ncbi:hypothetical protein PLESTB_001328600 [Pleodorina starrii]|uniref:Radical SAM core domain-containing protein n=1 Tax=Pleodorina starrii TaxID=330485 RepID=A0A9W6BUA9_9CHLO|nr:hypothetical protein PLESTB_001328600 [Pleodorina starrii]